MNLFAEIRQVAGNAVTALDQTWKAITELQRIHRLEYLHRLAPLERAIVRATTEFSTLEGGATQVRHQWGAVVRVPLGDERKLQFHPMRGLRYRLFVEGGGGWIEFLEVMVGSLMVGNHTLSCEFNAEPGDIVTIRLRNLLENAGVAEPAENRFP